MAIGGSFSQDAFTPKDPWRTWAEVQGLGLYWDTDNQFAAGKQGVRQFDTPITSTTRSGVRSINAPLGTSRSGVRSINAPLGTSRQPRYDLGVDAPTGKLEAISAKEVNMFDSTSPISDGDRNYGDQTIDRDELARLSSMGSTVASAVAPVAERVGQSWAGVRARRRFARETEQQARGIEQQGRAMMAQGVPPAPGAGGPSPLPPPAPGAGRPGGLPAPQAPLAPQKHSLATSNWREVQAQRIAEQAMGQPGQPAPDVTLGSRMYQEERAQERANRPAPASAPGVTTSAQRWENARRLQTEREAAAKFERENKGRAPVTAPPGGVGTAKIFPRGPISMVGDQNARLAAEGAAPAQPAPKK